MDADHRLAELAEHHHGLITRTQAYRLGLSPKQVRTRVERGRLLMPSSIVLTMPGSPRTPEQEILEAVWSSGPSALASRSTAAWLHRLDGATRPSPPEVSVRRPAGGNRTLALVHETVVLEPADRTTVRDIPCTNATRSIIDIAADVAADELERLLDSALRQGLTTAPRLLWRLDQLGSSGRSGSAELLKLLGVDRSARRHCESWLESETLRLFANVGLPAPEVQRVERDRSGKVIRCDFAFAAGQLVVEVSGHATHATRRQRQADAERRAELALLGVVHVEFTYEDVTERPHYVTARVFQMLDALGDQGPGTE